MSGLSLSLNNALSGLNVNQQALAVLSQNIANANTPGYSKQIVNQQSVYLDGQGQGVSVQDVTRKVDAYLVSAVQRQTSTVSQNNVVSDYQDRIQILMGQPGSQTNISAYTTNFFNSMQSLAQTPDDSTLQQSVVNSANTLATGISSLASNLYDLQLQADSDIKSSVDNINSDLTQLAAINSTIASAHILGKSTADLEDKQDALLNDLSQYLDIRTYKRDSGAVTISTVGGVTLLSESNYKVSYNAQSSSLAFSQNSGISPIYVTRLDENGQPTGTPQQLVTGGTSSTVASSLVSGKIKGLLEIRDQDIPGLLSQLDNMASNLRDQVNAIHNTGSGYPPASQYVGTRLVSATATSQWSGSVRIGVVGTDGQPVSAPYANPAGAQLAPLTIDLSSLDSGLGAGKPSTQTIIDEINQYYGSPQNKVQLGNLDNIRLASQTQTLPGNPPNFTFDFDLSNLSQSSSNFYLTGIQVKDDANNNVTSVTANIPSVTLASTSTYTTTDNSTTVTVKSAAAHNFTEGERIYLSTPPGDVNGIPASALGGFFTIHNVTATGFDIDVTQAATSSGHVDVLNQTAKPPYTTVDANSATRTASDGSISADLTGSLSSQYYTVIANVAVDDGKGNITQSQITYRINSLRSGVLNSRVAATSATGDGVVVSPTSSQPILTASLVDANGNTISKINGKYPEDAQGYLSIKANATGQAVVIDSLDSTQLGDATTGGTGRGFSYYFEMNNFFDSNAPTPTGDTYARSALNLKVQDRLLNNANYVSSGSLTLKAAADGSTTGYTYERLSGDNSIIQKLATLGTAPITFAQAGNIGTTTQSFDGYAGSIITSTAQTAQNATTAKQTAQTLLDGFTQRSSSISGVNLDNELANTVIYQNAYAASARIITVTNTLFDALLQAAGS